MPAPLRVSLTKKEDHLLLKLTQVPNIPQGTKERATVLRLSARGWKVAQIAEYLEWNQQTVRETIHRWHRGKWVLLWDEARPGRGRRWQNQDIEELEEKLLTEQRTYNSRQLCEHLKKYRQATVIVLDNYSIHKSGEVKAKIPQWEDKHLYLFYLPEYCCEWNRIEDEWHQIKEHELVGQMFADEYDLAMAVIAAVEERGRKNGYISQRFRFHKQDKSSVANT